MRDRSDDPSHYERTLYNEGTGAPWNFFYLYIAPWKKLSSVYLYTCEKRTIFRVFVSYAYVCYVRYVCDEVGVDYITIKHRDKTNSKCTLKDSYHV